MNKDMCVACDDGICMEELILIRPTSEYASQIAQYKQEFLDADDSMDGTGALRITDAQATRSKEKSPTRPQFKAPIITRIKQSLSNIISTPFVKISFTKKVEIYKKATVFQLLLNFLK